LPIQFFERVAVWLKVWKERFQAKAVNPLRCIEATLQSFAINRQCTPAQLRVKMGSTVLNAIESAASGEAAIALSTDWEGGQIETKHQDKCK